MINSIVAIIVSTIQIKNRYFADFFNRSNSILTPFYHSFTILKYAYLYPLTYFCE